MPNPADIDPATIPLPCPWCHRASPGIDETMPHPDMVLRKCKGCGRTFTTIGRRYSGPYFMDPKDIDVKPAEVPPKGETWRDRPPLI